LELRRWGCGGGGAGEAVAEEIMAEGVH
jgi:hypothetical protein